MTEFEKSLIDAMDRSTKATQELARQIRHQTTAIQALVESMISEDDDIEDVQTGVMNPRADEAAHP